MPKCSNAQCSRGSNETSQPRSVSVCTHSCARLGISHKVDWVYVGPPTLRVASPHHSTASCHDLDRCRCSRVSCTDCLLPIHAEMCLGCPSPAESPVMARDTSKDCTRGIVLDIDNIRSSHLPDTVQRANPWQSD